MGFPQSNLSWPAITFYSLIYFLRLIIRFYLANSFTWSSFLSGEDYTLAL